MNILFFLCVFTGTGSDRLPPEDFADYPCVTLAQIGEKTVAEVFASPRKSVTFDVPDRTDIQVWPEGVTLRHPKFPGAFLLFYDPGLVVGKGAWKVAVVFHNAQGEERVIGPREVRTDDALQFEVDRLANLPR